MTSLVGGALELDSAYELERTLRGIPYLSSDVVKIVGVAITGTAGRAESSTSALPTCHSPYLPWGHQVQ
jgi:hypothetical protein